MGEIILSNRVQQKLKSLAFLLYKKEYFGFLDTAENYVDEIENTMYSIPNLKHGKSKDPSVGRFFVRHKQNSKTTYYICFNIKDDRYLIKNIITNHEEEYKRIIDTA